MGSGVAALTDAMFSAVAIPPAVAVCAATAALAAAPLSLSAQSSSWTEPMRPFALAENVYYVGTAGLAAFLFTSDEGHILVDAPLEENVPGILENIRSLGFDPADIEVQLASHAHFDHVGGLSAMGAATGADLVLSEADAAYVSAGVDFGLSGITGGYDPIDPDRIIGHGEIVRLGSHELTAHLTPGHTPGCTSWSGTLVIEGEPYSFVSVCSLSVLGNYRIVGDDPTYEGQAADYCRSVAHLRTLDPDVFLGPHPGWFGMDEKLAAREAGETLAFVEGERYRAYLDGAEASIEEALAEQGHVGGCAALATR